MSFLNIPQIDRSLLNGQGYLDSKVSALVAPKTTRGVAGWVFDIPQSESLSLSADITDHYTESGSFLNDHRVIQPARITLSGIVGELVFDRTFIDDVFAGLQNKLEIIDDFAGGYTSGQFQSINRILNLGRGSFARLNQQIEQTKNLINAFRGDGQYKTLQQRAFMELESLFRSQEILTCETPWKYYDNMVIESLDFSQGADSEDFSDVTITLKEMRFARVQVIDFDETLFANRNQVQSQEKTETGKVQGKQKGNGILLSAIKAIGAK